MVDSLYTSDANITSSTCTGHYWSITNATLSSSSLYTTYFYYTNLYSDGMSKKIEITKKLIIG